jgi:hypothetical protein
LTEAISHKHGESVETRFDENGIRDSLLKHSEGKTWIYEDFSNVISSNNQMMFISQNPRRTITVKTAKTVDV